MTFHEIKSLGPNRDYIHLYHVLSPCVFESGCCRLCSSGPFDPFTQHYCLNCAGYFNSGIFDIDRRVGCKWHTEAGSPLCLLRVLLQYVCSSCYLYYTFTAVTRLSFTHSCSRVIEDQERSIIWVSYAFFSICASYLGLFSGARPCTSLLLIAFLNSEGKQQKRNNRNRSLQHSEAIIILLVLSYHNGIIWQLGWLADLPILCQNQLDEWG